METMKLWSEFCSLSLLSASQFSTSDDLILFIMLSETQWLSLIYPHKMMKMIKILNFHSCYIQQFLSSIYFLLSEWRWENERWELLNFIKFCILKTVKCFTSSVANEQHQSENFSPRQQNNNKNLPFIISFIDAINFFLQINRKRNFHNLICMIESKEWRERDFIPRFFENKISSWGSHK